MNNIEKVITAVNVYGIERIVMGFLFIVLILMAALFVLKKIGLIPKWFSPPYEKKTAIRVGHLGCPFVSDIPVLVEETKNFTSAYMVKFVINRISAPSSYAKRKLGYLKNVFLGQYSERMYELKIPNHDEKMGLVRILTAYLFNFIDEEIRDVLLRNHFPVNDNDWKEYKKVQIDFIISETCRRMEHIYPPVAALPVKELHEMIYHVNFANELDIILNFARIDFDKMAAKAQKENERFSKRIVAIINGSLRTDMTMEE